HRDLAHASSQEIWMSFSTVAPLTHRPSPAVQQANGKRTVDSPSSPPVDHKRSLRSSLSEQSPPPSLVTPIDQRSAIVLSPGEEQSASKLVELQPACREALDA